MKLPDYVGEASSRRFHHELFESHLKDAAFLYEQRLLTLKDPESSWRRAASLEDRLEAHIEGLIAGDDAALAVCMDHAVGGDASELFVATCVLCRRASAPMLAEVLKRFDRDDPLKVQALIDALKYELPAEWREYCRAAVEAGNPKLAPMLAWVLGYRRARVDDVLLNSLNTAAPPAFPPLLWSIGRTRGDRAADVVRPLLQSSEKGTAAAAMHAALRLGDDEALRRLLASAARGDVDPVALGLAAGRGMTTVLLTLAPKPETATDALIALGLLGDLPAVRPLIDLLSVEEAAGPAADALHVITGADLFEDVLVPEPPNEDEMFPEEVAAFHERGEVPQRADGRPFGTTVHRLSRDPAVWQEWVASNSSRFAAGRRHRCGVLYSPGTLLDCLRSESYPKPYRDFVGEELLIRYGVDLSFEPDMFVAQQQRVLGDAARTVAQATERFEAGEWYFAGRPVN